MTDAPLVGQILAGRYEVVREIGRGALGIVYKGKHRILDRTVAIKVLFGGVHNDFSAQERFKREAQATSQLSHPNVVTIFDFGITPDQLPYIVMDYVNGETLQHLITRLGRLQSRRAVPIFIQICDGMAHAHSRGIIHRDLKPENVILTRDYANEETVKIVDFGIAKRFMDEGERKLTAEGQVVGTPAYMSPEQIMGARRIDARSDIYSMGCLMFTTLTGTLPISGANSVETMAKHVANEPMDVGAACPEAQIPIALQDLLMRCLKKFPEERPQSMMDLKMHLENLL